MIMITCGRNNFFAQALRVTVFAIVQNGQTVLCAYNSWNCHIQHPIDLFTALDSSIITILTWICQNILYVIIVWEVRKESIKTVFLKVTSECSEFINHLSPMEDNGDRTGLTGWQLWSFQNAFIRHTAKWCVSSLSGKKNSNKPLLLVSWCTFGLQYSNNTVMPYNIWHITYYVRRFLYNFVKNSEGARVHE